VSTVTRILGHRYGVAGLVLVALLAVYGIAAVSRPHPGAQAQGALAAGAGPGSGVSAGGQAPVESAIAVCPDPASHGKATTRVSAMTPPTSRKGGQAEIRDAKGGKPLTTLTAPGTTWNREAAAPAGPYTVRGGGPMAGGLAVEQTTVTTKGPDRGLAGVRCAAPGTDLWFLGSGPVEAKNIDLYVTNVDDQPAAVDIEAVSGEGPLDTSDGRGVPVDPYRTKVIGIGKSAEGLGNIVDSARVLALHVRATTGRVAASARIRTGKGVDWVPVAPLPATSLVVPGIPGGPGSRRLLVTVPGEFDARVSVQAITANGAFAPQGQDTLDAPAQTVTPLDLDQALAGKAAAIRLTSDRPITAGFIARVDDDLAYGAGTAPLRPGGVVADNRGADSAVLLTAPDGAASVRIMGFAGQGAVGRPQDVQVAGGRTLEVRVAAPPGAAKGFGIMITPRPGSGPVYAARALRAKGNLITVLPVVPAVTTVDLPKVGDSLTSVVP
jgi:hypothetical protein